jgi:pyruvate/2-oxoglutarate dehydrogenase complex dihydrolipoamide dehydrogenase (E3) component
VQRKLSYVVIEKDAFVASTIARYPKGKKVMAEPYDVRCVGLLPVWDSSKEGAIAEWNRVLSEVGLDIRMREVVESVKHEGTTFLVKTDKSSFRSQKVLLCIGTRGKPRRLNVPGEDQPWVQPLLDDPDLYKGKTLLVIGGGDSAVEAAIALAASELRNKVILSYRGKGFNRVKAKNRQDLDQLVNQQRILLLLGSTVQQFSNDGATLKLAEGRSRDIKFQGAFVLIGGDPPLKWLESMGIAYVPKAMPSLSDEESPQDASSIRKSGGKRRDTRNVTIMVPKEQFLLHLPDKMQMDGDAHKVSEIRR